MSQKPHKSHRAKEHKHLNAMLNFKIGAKSGKIYFAIIK